MYLISVEFSSFLLPVCLKIVNTMGYPELWLFCRGRQVKYGKVIPWIMKDSIKFERMKGTYLSETPRLIFGDLKHIKEDPGNTLLPV